MHCFLFSLISCIVAVFAFANAEGSVLELRQAPGTPLYDCHAECGGIIEMSQTQGYCTFSNFTTTLKECLDCALVYDIWQYYGSGVTSAAKGCGIDATPVPANSSATSTSSNSAQATGATSTGEVSTSASASASETGTAASAGTAATQSATSVSATTSQTASGKSSSATAAASTGAAAGGSLDNNRLGMALVPFGFALNLAVGALL